MSFRKARLKPVRFFEGPAVVAAQEFDGEAQGGVAQGVGRQARALPPALVGDARQDEADEDAEQDQVQNGLVHLGRVARGVARHGDAPGQVGVAAVAAARGQAAEAADAVAEGQRGHAPVRELEEREPVLPGVIKARREAADQAAVEHEAVAQSLHRERERARRHEEVHDLAADEGAAEAPVHDVPDGVLAQAHVRAAGHEPAYSQEPAQGDEDAVGGDLDGPERQEDGEHRLLQTMMAADAVRRPAPSAWPCVSGPRNGKVSPRRTSSEERMIP